MIKLVRVVSLVRVARIERVARMDRVDRLISRGAKQETEYSGHFNELLKTDRLSYSSIVQLVPLG